MTANATYGDVQGANSAPSTAHSNVASGSSAVKVKTACSSVLGAGGPCWPGRMRPAGPEVIVAVGAETISHRRSAGVGSTLPAMSTARIRNRWVPGSSETVSGELQGSNGPLLIEHSNSTRCAGVALSEPKNSNVASVSAVRPLGPAVMPVPGGLTSSAEVQVWTTGDGSTLPSNSGLPGSGNSGSNMSRARTSNRCGPGASSKSAYV